jgi:hypothetical protein
MNNSIDIHQIPSDVFYLQITTLKLIQCIMHRLYLFLLLLHAGHFLVYGQKSIPNSLQATKTSLKICCAHQNIDSSRVSFIRPEFLLASIQDSYCALQLYNPDGFLVHQQTKADVNEIEQLRLIITGKSGDIKPCSDSSKNIALEQKRWVDNPSKRVDMCPVNSWIILCFWTHHSAVEVQYSRMRALLALQYQLDKIPVEVQFVNQDYLH